MELAHYIIFHPDKYGKTEIRQKVNVTASALVKDKLNTDWSGSIYVDQIQVGNEDPFVLVEPWLYSFCHASQLRRNNTENRIDSGSILIFASGDYANKAKLVVDTVFVVDKIHAWGKYDKENSIPTLPESFKTIYKTNCDLWNRHFKYPFEGQHARVTHSYSAKLWTKETSMFSFLPISNSEERVSFSLDSIDLVLSSKIIKHVNGKIPVRLSNTEINMILSKVNELSSSKVIRDIKLKEEILVKDSGEKCSIC